MWKYTKYFRKKFYPKGSNKANLRGTPSAVHKPQRCRLCRQWMLDTAMSSRLSVPKHTHPSLGSSSSISETSFQVDPSLESWPHHCQKLLLSNKSLKARSCYKAPEFLMTIHKVTLNSHRAKVRTTQSHLKRTRRRKSTWAGEPGTTVVATGQCFEQGVC